MNEEYESPYCDICGTCGYIDCCGIRNFIEEHIEGKTNCKNEDLIISELIDLCDYKDKVFEENKRLKEDNYELQKYINEEEGFVKDENRELGLRIDKAIEKLKDLYSYADNEEYVDNYCKDLLNILQGSDDND